MEIIDLSNLSIEDYNEEVDRIITETFTDTKFGKISYYELSNILGVKKVYALSTNKEFKDWSNRRKNKLPRLHLTPPQKLFKEGNKLKKDYRNSQPEEITPLDFAKKVAKYYNGKITYKSPSGSAYITLPNRERVRISDHWVIDRDPMSPKTREDYNIVYNYFDVEMAVDVLDDED